ncbi:MAG TPA: SDR family oxidoreductase [Gemmatimonadales bacterium]|nr:SDR family oxidoreductase [Gemmatimonadales bacterium]
MKPPATVFRPDLLAGQVALITGGGTGIGLGIAASLAAAGADIAIASRKPEHLEPAAERLRAVGPRVRTVEVNVREPDSVARMMEQVSQHYGRLDILVNNAAGNFYAPSATLSPNGWRAVVETDLYGTFYCCQAAYPLLKARGGRIVSISMTLHYRGWPLMAHATAAKAGVDALTRTLALEWAHDRITVNAVAPGPIPTEGVRKAFTPPGADAPDLFNMEKFAADSIPLGRWGTPEDIGQLVTYLASSAGDWITGSIFVVDGGAWLATPKATDQQG